MRERISAFPHTVDNELFASKVASFYLERKENVAVWMMRKMNVDKCAVVIKRHALHWNYNGTVSLSCQSEDGNELLPVLFRSAVVNDADDSGDDEDHLQYERGLLFYLK